MGVDLPRPVRGLEVLALSDPEQAGRWSEVWGGWPGREIWAHPEYVRLFAGEGSPLLFHFADDSRQILFALVLRRVPEALSGGETCWDLMGPYGYGGPYVFLPEPPGCFAFWQAFATWARQVQCVALFSRLDLDQRVLLPDTPGVMTVANNIVRSLELSLEEIWMDYDHKVRKNVKRALREGVSVEVDTKGEKLDGFLHLYQTTMVRRAAARSFFFTRDWFERLVAKLEGHFAFFHSFYRGVMISTELVLISARKVYSFLGGTDPQYYELRPNDLLKHEIIRWAKDNGKDAYVLGGGFVSGQSGGDDGIFRHKRAFAPSGVVPFKVMKLVLDQVRYDALVRAWERLSGVPADPLEGFFPAYRKPLPAAPGDEGAQEGQR